VLLDLWEAIDLRAVKTEFAKCMLRGACEMEHWEMASQLWSIYSEEYPAETSADELLTLRNAMFVTVCTYGKMRAAKWVWGLGPRLADQAMYQAFGEACRGGYIEIAEWIWAFEFQAPRHDPDYNVLMITCERGRMRLAKWLYSLGFRMSVRANDDYVLRNMCESRNLEMAKWLWSMYDPEEDLSALQSELFLTACVDECAPLAKWVWSLSSDGEIDLRHNHDQLFREACSDGQIDMIQLLIECSDKHPEIRYLAYRDNYFIVGAEWSAHVHVIEGIVIGSMNPATETDAYAVLEMVQYKKSARSCYR